MTPDRINEIRSEVLARQGREPPKVAAPTPTPPPVVLAANDDRPVDVAEVVELLLASIPNLRTFRLAVDDTGEASVDFTVREVRVVEAARSVKVPAKK